ncbi:2-heptyl-3-hydroxy-4(1H)-quinolone synthase [Streptomyces sp. RB5]|uniref:2-heptyl-3-hydroxy-4(1H)-quinolone synthase n=1 Tax=Streptomyces smaragdinus TaxID=2585196 RepID=A0A7K0C9R0_9ACTN|nr:FAD-dependent monooxygenase [Streptomyces smaragdinus]MQY10189.1 2-heptyl-3-hydroxy-4(1H)-quinolone synthase [Streptomyces smaragdinus]
MPDSQPRRVLIVGGGITGGVLALALRKQGVAVVLVDLRNDLGGVGHGITLQGNALKAFKAVGIYDRLAEHAYAFDKVRLRRADGSLMAEIDTPPMGGADLPPTMGALRGDLADIIAADLPKAGVDVRLGATVTAFEDKGTSVTVQLSDGTQETVDLLVGADGIRSKVRGMCGITDEPTPVGMGIWRTVARRPEAMDCSELYYGGPKYKAGYTPISDELCYAFLIEGNLDRSFIGEGPRGAVLKERGQGYGGIWGQVRDSIADDAIVNYQWIEAMRVDAPWYRGRTIIIGDAAHACPPLIAQGAAMCAEDAVVLAEMLTCGDEIDDVLPAFMARRFPRVRMVLDNSLRLAEWEIHPETPGADPGWVMGETLHAVTREA